MRKNSILLSLIILLYLLFTVSCSTDGDFSEIKDACNILGPDDKATSYDGMPNFSWEAVSGASEYELIINDEIIISTDSLSYTIPESSKLESGHYLWKIRSKNYFQYYPCGERELTVVIPRNPDLITPTRDACIDTATPSFFWIDGGGIESYTIEISKNKDFSDLIFTDSTTLTTYTCKIKSKTADTSGELFQKVKMAKHILVKFLL